jgi:rhodanese-related sulfurtransferase
MKGALIGAVLIGLLAPALAAADPSCCGGCGSKAVVAITADELKALQESATKPTVVNVLPPEAYRKAHIAGSINVPLAHLKSLAGRLNKESTVVTYCAGPGCSASDKAAEQLQALGFKSVRVYKGGIQEWSAAGRPVEKGEPVRYVSRDELKSLRESGKAFTLVDVLSVEDHAKAHIAGSVNIPLADLERRAGELDKDGRIVVYCYNYICQASTQAAEKLTKLGFKDVSDYKGGYHEWKEAGLPLEGSEAKPPAETAGPAGPAGAAAPPGGCAVSTGAAKECPLEPAGCCPGSKVAP